MQEPANLAGAIQLCTLLLEAANAQHLVEQAQSVFAAVITGSCVGFGRRRAHRSKPLQYGRYS